jgi:hypothetical protein
MLVLPLHFRFTCTCTGIQPPRYFPAVAEPITRGKSGAELSQALSSRAVKTIQSRLPGSPAHYARGPSSREPSSSTRAVRGSRGLRGERASCRSPLRHCTLRAALPLSSDRDSRAASPRSPSPQKPAPPPLTRRARNRRCLFVAAAVCAAANTDPRRPASRGLDDNPCPSLSRVAV